MGSTNRMGFLPMVGFEGNNQVIPVHYSFWPIKIILIVMCFAFLNTSICSIPIYMHQKGKQNIFFIIREDKLQVSSVSEVQQSFSGVINIVSKDRTTVH